MQTYFLMGIFLLMYAAVAVIGIRKRTDEDVYFGEDDTNVLKGLWCIIVILVHVPAAYQNRIQDMIGSFAYIGVTFFFMTSAYGLKYGIAHKKNYLHNFWIKRLPKLLVPAFLINILSVLNRTIFGGDDFDILSLININRWVLVLLLFYFAFWVANSIKFSNKINRGGYLPDCIVCIVVIAYSLITYLADGRLGTQWSTECFGFIYGLVFAQVADRYETFGKKKWLCKLCISVFIGLILGVTYLKFKPVVFIGDYILKILLGVALSNVLLQFIIKFKLGNRISRFLGRISYEVYLLHGVAFSFLTYVLPDLESGVFIVFAVVITVTASTIVVRLSRCFLERIDRIIAGE